jgi:hypothetical protein
MFGMRKRTDAQTMESIREQLAAADMHARSVLSAVAQTESRWAKDREDRSRAQVSAETAIEDVRSSVAENAADVAKVLEKVADTCEMVVSRLEADRHERRALTEAITMLSRQLTAPVDTPSRVHGGMVLAAEGDAVNGDAVNGDALNGDAAYIDLVAHETVEATPPVEDPPRTIERFRPFATPPVAPSSEPVQVLEPVQVVEPVEVVDPVPAVESAPAPFVDPIVPAKPFDPFAGLPLLAPKPTAPPAEVGSDSPFAPVAPSAPFGVVEPVPPVEPEAPNGIERQWSESYRLTEVNSYRPQGGTRLTPRRSGARSTTP